MNATHTRRWQAATVAAVLLSAVSAAPASAGPLHDPSLPALSASTIGSLDATWWPTFGGRAADPSRHPTFGRAARIDLRLLAASRPDALDH
jgi:hypothetical protein